MSAQSIIEQLLNKGLSSLGGGGAPRGDNGRGNDLGKYATGAAVGGVLGLLLGSKGGRRMGGKALQYGSVAALGALAYRAYNDYQARQAASARPAEPAAPAFEQLPAPQVEAHSRAMLKAMIAAAKSDGHLDERERGLVEAELQRSEADPAVRQWVEAELRRPVEPADVAAAAQTPAMGAEIYLASLLVVDETTTMERAYLDELARQLKLPAELKADLEARAAAA
jgi:uncharacterized membrane protein YebE (DUF533 family)